MRRAGTVVPQAVLIEEGWGSDAEVNGATLYVFMRSLRAKVTKPGEVESSPHGPGYRLFIARGIMLIRTAQSPSVLPSGF